MAVPAADQQYVDRLRRFIKDEEAINTLLEAEENTDEFLYECLEDAIQEINWKYMPTTEYVFSDISFTGNSGLPWIIAKNGAVLKFLTGAGIHSARNTFSYSDGSGIQVTDTDTWGRYINFFNVLKSTYETMAKSFKLKKNIEDCYGGVASQYDTLS